MEVKTGEIANDVIKISTSLWYVSKFSPEIYQKAIRTLTTEISTSSRNESNIGGIDFPTPLFYGLFWKIRAIKLAGAYRTHRVAFQNVV